jgi:Domain of unknown function (DUF6904)
VVEEVALGGREQLGLVSSGLAALLFAAGAVSTGGRHGWQQQESSALNRLISRKTRPPLSLLFSSATSKSLAMLTSSPTKYGAGITLYGDFLDFDTVHKTIHKIAREGFAEEHVQDFIYGLACNERTVGRIFRAHCD